MTMAFPARAESGTRPRSLGTPLVGREAMKKHHHLWIILSVAFLFACGDANEDDPQDEPP